MIGPEITYQFQQPKDTAGGLILIASRELSVNDTATSITIELLDVAPDKIFVMSVASVFGLAGAAQVLQRLLISLSADQPVTGGIEISQTVLPAATTSQALNWSGELWVPPGGNVAVRGIFDAGVASNQVSGQVHGILIPRGNVQQG